MRFAVYFAFLIATVTPVLAETPMSAAEFDAYTQGKTLYFYNDGQAYGVEQYLPNNRVRWSFLDGECKDGTWYQSGEFICFVYEDREDPQCWTFFKQGNSLRALFEDDPNATELYEAGNTDDEMLCLGPEVGV
ncbi:hypothetical protein [Actibacterium sp. 188UL27-1]|uniref:hypothetical protein n=1 Tax=Actibacterium sp. 188UL27-1 TaxID=2786961 RepID=UPI00195EBAEF|nr:hypothetical protein [Actibacterium sp. 188UL27-1]MBM7068741.1 hypothetical protein [Actibacterium sp. 188UL27-1]